MVKKQIVVVPFAAYDPFFQQVRGGGGAEAAGKVLSEQGFEVEWLDEHGVSVEKQIETIRFLRSQGVSGIVICPLDPIKLKEPIAHCVNENTPVATFCLDSPESGRFFHIGQDLHQSGRLAGSLLGKFIGGKGSVGIITGFFDVEGLEERRKGCIEVLQQDFPDVQVAWEEENHDRWQEACEIVKDHLAENDELSGLYITGGGPFGVAKALEEIKPNKRIPMVCFDFVPETLGFIRKGIIDAAIGQDPFAQGRCSVMTVYEYIAFGRKPLAEIKYVKLEIAVKENLDYIDERIN